MPRNDGSRWGLEVNSKSFRSLNLIAAEILFVVPNLKDCHIVPPRNDDKGSMTRSLKKIIANSRTNIKKSAENCFSKNK